jgi:hypothetical protein
MLIDDINRLLSSPACRRQRCGRGSAHVLVLRHRDSGMPQVVGADPRK